jgi:hypothetical protein
MPKAQRTPHPSSAFESPVKTSINVDDGVIDVDVPLPDFITSFESAVSSPSSSGYLSASGFGAGLDAFEQSFRFAADGDVPLNVAGWLQHYHPDFVLQALPPQHNILDEIKESMRAEPTPPLPPGGPSPDDTSPTERWIDITSAIVADATTFTITRLRYRRLVRLKHHHPAHTHTHTPTPTPGPATQSTTTTPPTITTPPTAASPSNEAQLKEEFIQEPVVAFDDVLVDAVERVVAAATGGCGGASTEATVSKAGSASSSRSTSKRRERERQASLSAGSGSGVGSGGVGGGVGVEGLCPPPPPPPTGQGLGTQNQGLMPIVTGASASPSASAAAGGGVQEVPRSQCKTVLLTALEDIIHDVIGERELAEGGEGHGHGHGHGHGGRARESPLREAVRGWIEGLDLVGAAAAAAADC